MKGDPSYVDDTLGSAGASPHRHASPFAPPAAPPPPQKQGAGCFQKWLLVVGAIVIVSFGGCFIGLAVLGATAPPEYALPGQQLPKQERKAINDLNLLRPGERIVYFYAEGFSAEDKMVFFTDTRLVTYDDDLPRPDFEVPLSQVRSVRVIYREGFLGAERLHRGDGHEPGHVRCCQRPQRRRGVSSSADQVGSGSGWQREIVLETRSLALW